jgi:hypothetical protein
MAPENLLDGWHKVDAGTSFSSIPGNGARKSS